MTELRPVLLAVLPLLLSAALVILGHVLLMTLLPIRLQADRVDIGLVGLVTGAFYLGLVIGPVLVGPLVGLVGQVRTFVGAGCLFVVAVLLHPVADSLIGWAALRAVAGLAVAVIFVVIESWLNAKTPNSQRGTILATYMVFYYGAASVAPLPIALIDIADDRLFNLIAVFVVLALMLLALVRLDTPPDIASPRLALRRLYRLSPVGTVGGIAAGLLVSSLGNLGPIWASTVTQDKSGIAAAMALTTVGALLFQVPIGRLSDFLDRRAVILGIAVGVILTGMVLTVVTTPGPLLYGGVLITGALIATLYPICVSHVNDFMESKDIVGAAGAMITVFGLSSIVGPPLAGQLMALTGPNGLFLFHALVAGLFGAFVAYRMTRRPTIDNAAQSSFVGLTATSAAVVELDPRVEEAEEQLSFDFLFPEDEADRIAATPVAAAGD